MKKYKYKREHFATYEEFVCFRKRQARAQVLWLKKYEQANPEHRERRLLRQRLYSRYYNHADSPQSFADWLKENYRVDNIKSISVERLRAIAAKC